MARIEPKFDVQLFNDPAISPGQRVENVITMQYNGFLIGALFKAAGAEGIRLFFSDGEESQHIPAQDIAIDSDTLAELQGPGPGKAFNNFTLMNQPMKQGTKISIVQEGTGTAEGNVWLLFAKSAMGAYILNVAVLVDLSAAALNDTLLDCPTFMPRFKRCFIRGAAGNDITVKLGAGGQSVVIPCRAIAINTDIQPWNYHSIDSETPDKIIFESMNGFSGTAWLYFQFE